MTAVVVVVVVEEAGAALTLLSFKTMYLFRHCTADFPGTALAMVSQSSSSSSEPASCSPCCSATALSKASSWAVDQPVDRSFLDFAAGDAGGSSVSSSSAAPCSDDRLLFLGIILLHLVVVAIVCFSSL